MSESVKRVLIVENERGLHARPASKFVTCAGGFDADITVTRDGETVPGTSILGLLMLGAGPGTELLVEAKGAEAAAALDALEALLKSGFGEG